MDKLISILGLGIGTFAITNIDDLLILSIYFADPKFKKSSIIVGQYLGVSALVLISLSGLVLGQLINPQWLGLLGLIPVFLGIKGIVHLFKTKQDENSHTTVPNRSNIQFLNVTAVTIANGADNIGVYTPIFANATLYTTLLFIAVFIIMIGVWCALAYYFVKHPLIKDAFARYGHIILPFFLLLLGMYILYESKVWTIFG